MPDRRIGSLTVLAILFFCSVAGASSGVVGATPKPRPNEDYEHFVATRFRAKVGKRTDGPGKIVFVSMGMHGPAGARSYAIQTNLNSYHFDRDDGECDAAMLPSSSMKPWPTLTFAVVDYPKSRETGIRVPEEGFPRVAGLVDGIKDLWIMGATGDFDLTNKEIEVWVVRGDTFTDDLDDWGFGCRADGRLLPGTQYVRWHVIVTTPGGGHYGATYAFPELYARYVRPVAVLTEFFEHPGLYQVFFWNAAAQREGSDTWEPLTHWELNYPPAGPGRPTDRGVRMAIVDGHPAVEVSNDGTATYLSNVGDPMEVP